MTLQMLSAITVFGDEQHVIRAIEAGATGYLLKDGSNSYIAQSIIQSKFSALTIMEQMSEKIKTP